jgi:hypothetical protein
MWFDINPYDLQQKAIKNIFIETALAEFSDP